jgi:glutamate-ammonia-ligase adenylyltransferase
VALRRLPEQLRHLAENAASKVREACAQALGSLDELPEEVLASLGPVGAISPYVVHRVVLDPWIVQRVVCWRSGGPEVDVGSLAMWYDDISDETALMRILRRWRHREMATLAWLDIAGWLPIESVLQGVSEVAEVCVQVAVDWLFEEACRIRGKPVDRGGRVQNLVVLGMGKLGARELNFSSDIDFIFAYGEDGVLHDRRGTSYQEFYTRLARSLVRVLDTVTEDGFVFRVDTRLRPFGESGPLVMSFEGFEKYYQGQARAWERYAMVKVRAIAGDREMGREFERFFRPFVYRRYLDYRAIAELRSLKAKIAAELQRRDRGDNIKLGVGGIREIEFIAQAFQLIRGGQQKALQERGILIVLDRLGELGLLEKETAQFLRRAYLFLRTIENRLQQYEDMQVHDLPTDPELRTILAFAMGYDGWKAFSEHLTVVRRRVHSIFEAVIADPSKEEIPSVFLERRPEDMIKELEDFGEMRDAMAQALLQFRESAAVRRLSQQGLSELNRILPSLLKEIAVRYVERPDEVLARVLRLLESIASRSVYFSLLAENPPALVQLVQLAVASPWIVQQVALTPILLDELLDSRTLYRPLTRAELRADLVRALETVEPGDSEQLMIRLRQFKASRQLRIAAADVMGVIPVMIVSDYLTDLAEVLVGEALTQAWSATAMRHGEPPVRDADASLIRGFAVIAYGKFGGIELGYGSDLDLVFLYDGVQGDALTVGERPITCAEFYARVAKRLVSILSTRMVGGILYEVDLRLRPSGNSGLLVSSADAYETYQMESAWTWEQQALVRARFVAGDVQVGQRFDGVRRRVLCRPRDRAKLRSDVREMREKMRENLANRDPAVFDLKQGFGGIADIEFIVQFGTLAYAAEHCEITRWTDTVRLLEGLRDVRFLEPEKADLLREAYCAYREQVHRLTLQESPARVPVSAFAEMRASVQDIWRKVMESE